jgi:WD40 repeat protein
VTVAAPPVPRSPYKGLAPFEDSDEDALFFFGRERDAEVIVANLLASRLTILYGPSGVGKSSVLGAAVVRRLRELAPDAEIAVLAEWTGEPELPRPAGEAFLLLDQFEEYFLYHDETLLLDALADLLARPRVHVLISLRDDALSRLDAFQGRVPGVLANRLRLEHLDREAARAAIVGPLERWNELTGEAVEIEPALIEAVLDEVSVAGDPHGRIEAPYLQLVLERIWATEQAAGSARLRLATLSALGGARAVVREHLQRALDGLTPDDQDLAASVFDHLVTPSGTKIALHAGDLAQYAGVPEESLRHVLGALSHDRIVHGVDGSDRYEIFHDVLAEPVRAWRERRRVERERAGARRRQRRLVAVAAAATVALVVVAGLAAWALSERGTARSQARQAHAHALEATALQQLQLDPERSVVLALQAALLQPGSAAEAVLRQALIADRLQRVLPAGGTVRALAYSPDGRLLVVGSDDGRTRVYDVRTGRLRGTIRDGGRVKAIAFSPDGTRFAAADGSGAVALVDAATARVLVTIRHRAAVSSVAFDATGQRLLTASADRTADLWDARSGRLLRTLVHPGPVVLARFGPHGLVVTVAAAGPGHARARLFDARTGRLVRLLPEPGVDDVRFSPDGLLLAIANYSGPTDLYRVPGGRLVRTLDDGGGPPLALAFSPNGELLATAGGDGVLRVWRVADGSRYFFFPQHTQKVVALAWSRDGTALADASLDGTSQLIDIGEVVPGTVVARLTGHGGGIETLAFAPDGRTLATGSDDGTARIWSSTLDEQLRLVGEPAGTVTSATFGPTARQAVSVGADGSARIWDVPHARLVRILRGAAPILDARISPDGRTVATASADGAVTLWNAKSGARLGATRLAGPASVVRFSPDGRLLAAGGGDGETVLLQVASRARLADVRRPGAVTALAFDADAGVLLAATRSGVSLWDVVHGSLLRAIDVPGGVTGATLSPDGALVATAGTDSLGRIYDAGSGTLLHVLRGHAAPLTEAVFAPDGRTLATTGLDGRPRLWSSRTGGLRHVLVGHFGPVRAVSFSPDGRWIVTAGPVSAGLWPTSTGRLLFYLRGHAGLLTGVSFGPDGRSILTSDHGTVRVYRCDVCVGLEGLVRIAETRIARAAGPGR